MSKRQFPETKKAGGAPAYMGQFASLMTILLAFFIILLSLGQNRTSKYKEGVGKVCNMIGLAGGSGVLEFWRTMRRPPSLIVFYDPENEDEAIFAGFPTGQADGFSLGDRFLNQINFKDPRQTLRLNSQIRFEPERLRLTRDTQFALDRAATLLYGLSGYDITVQVNVNSGAPDADRQLAVRRAAWVTRHLVDQARIAPERIRALGISEPGKEKPKTEQSEVCFLLRRTESKKSDDALPSGSSERSE